MRVSYSLFAASVVALALSSGAHADRLADQLDLGQRPFWVAIPPPTSVLESLDVPRTAEGLPDIFAEWVDHYQPLIPRAQSDRVLRAEDGDLVLPEDFASKEIYQAYLDRSPGDNPQIKCIPPHAPRIVAQPYKLEILRSESGARLEKIVFLHEVEHVIRKAYMNPDIKPDPTLHPYWGTSTAKWVDRSGDGKMDTLVVDTHGFEANWIEQIGLTYEDGAELREEYWLNEDGSILNMLETVTDPKTYSHPIQQHVWWSRAATDAEATFDEYACNIESAMPELILQRYQNGGGASK